MNDLQISVHSSIRLTQSDLHFVENVMYSFSPKICSDKIKYWTLLRGLIFVIISHTIVLEPVDLIVFNKLNQLNRFHIFFFI